MSTATLPFSRETLDRAAERMASVREAQHLYRVEIVRGEMRSALHVPALSVFAAAAAAMSLLVMIGEATPDDFLMGTVRVVSVVEQ